ncbi:hypothetical protein DOTSEDRAFT_134376 [Dothistroma septosporum NZE10]|uniref:Uncharacterized protein n=1 Tax=Dothistroma septosporum (strain NZE10 / CBS 128990) TaxID=675120 RepID=N1PIX7_DOTSN|nr:hypothetical protein DOTSEDRAFT_134376 [Dothistroma septosporum NZE10]
MCEHVRVLYKCGHLRFCVLCWCKCSKYTELQKCCPLKIQRYENLTRERCGKSAGAWSYLRRLIGSFRMLS